MNEQKQITKKSKLTQHWALLSYIVLVPKKVYNSVIARNIMGDVCIPLLHGRSRCFSLKEEKACIPALMCIPPFAMKHVSFDQTTVYFSRRVL